MAKNNDKRVELTTGIGTVSFPHVFTETVSTKDDGTKTYEIQLIISKKQRKDVQALLSAIKEVGEAKWGPKWRSVTNPLRDGDEEKDMLAEDGSTRGEKYPERLDCYFFNARSQKPVGVVDRDRVPITDPNDVYGGCKARLNVAFYPYSKAGNVGIGVSLNGVQKVADGDSLGSSRPSVESMFDMLDDEDFSDDGLDDVDEKPKKKDKAKGKGKAKAEPEPEVKPKAKKKKAKG